MSAAGRNPSGSPDSCQVYAVKYAERDARRSDHFVGGDAHDGPMPMDYFVWAVVSAGRTIVVDTGFGQSDADARGRRLVRSVTEALALVGIDTATAPEVILTHLHYDHVGGFDQFPVARFHLQDREIAFATGRHMTQPFFRHSFTPSQIADVVMAVHRDRVVFHDGDDEVAPGVTVHLIGGHTDGMQVVRVSTERGWMVLASDTCHFYENMETGRPFPIVFDAGAMVRGWDRLRELADHDDAIVPGHDPLVMKRYPVARPGLEGVAVRLDQGWVDAVG